MRFFAGVVAVMIVFRHGNMLMFWHQEANITTSTGIALKILASANHWRLMKGSVQWNCIDK